MTVSATQIPRISPFTVGASGDMTDADFAYYAGVAKELYLDVHDPGFPAVTYDHCHALLICHLFASKDGNLELTSMNLGGKFSGSKRTGETSWLADFWRIVGEFKEAKRKAALSSRLATDGGVRSDSTMPELELDRDKVPTFSELEARR